MKPYTIIVTDTDDQLTYLHSDNEGAKDVYVCLVELASTKTWIRLELFVNGALLYSWEPKRKIGA